MIISKDQSDAYLETIVKTAQQRNLIQTCCNCEQWNKGMQQCLFYKSLPPAEVIVVGCDLHSNEIPF